MGNLLTLLNLPATVTEGELIKAFERRKEELTAGLANAATPALQGEFAVALQELEAAWKVHLAQSAAVRSHLSRSGSFTQSPPSAEAAQAIELQPGQVLAQRYHIQTFIGQGGMGAVYRAYDATTERDIALKVLLPSLFRNEHAKARFMSEARLSQQLSHPHIVNVFDVQQHGELFFLTMELLEGQNLRGWLAKLKAEGRLPEIAEVKRIASELCDALAYAHEYTIHRDIKPDNIWLDAKGRVKLMDFGIAQVLSASQRTRSGASMGTAYYMAPEQLQGRELTAQGDIYAVGVLLYELLTGQIPAGRFDSAETLRPEIGKALSAVIDRCLQVNPDKRYASARALQQALPGGNSSLTSPGLLTRSGGPAVLAASVVVGVLLLGGLSYSGALGNVWQSLKPVDRAVLARQQADASQLLGEIRNLSSRLESRQQQLVRDLTEAERTGASQFAHLRSWNQLAQQHIGGSSELIRLEGEQVLGENLLRDAENISDAIAMLTATRNGYQALLDRFDAIAVMLEEATAAANAQREWEQYRSSYNLSDPPALAGLAALLAGAQDQQSAGAFADAIASYREIRELYQTARLEVADSVASIEAEKARQFAARLNRGELTEAQQALVAGLRMVEIPAGRFRMGSNEREDEQPVHEVSVAAFRMGAAEITVGQFRAFVAATDYKTEAERNVGREGCYLYRGSSNAWSASAHWQRPGFPQTDDHPVVCVSFNDVQAYLRWLNAETGGNFRLPSEAEWEYAARAGSTSKYHFGDDPAELCGYGNVLDQTPMDNGDVWTDIAPCRDGHAARTSAVRSFTANPFKLYDMHGNVSEWTQDCWHETYAGAPADGSAWISGGDCARRVSRGGSWDNYPDFQRSAYRDWGSVVFRINIGGFRVAQDLPR